MGFIFFLAVGFNNSHSGDNVLKVTCNVIVLPVLKSKDSAYCFPECINKERYERNQDEGKQCKLDVQYHHEDYIPDENKEDRKEVTKYIGHEITYVSGILGDPV